MKHYYFTYTYFDNKEKKEKRAFGCLTSGSNFFPVVQVMANLYSREGVSYVTLAAVIEISEEDADLMREAKADMDNTATGVLKA